MVIHARDDARGVRCSEGAGEGVVVCEGPAGVGRNGRGVEVVEGEEVGGVERGGGEEVEEF